MARKQRVRLTTGERLKPGDGRFETRSYITTPTKGASSRRKKIKVKRSRAKAKKQQQLSVKHQAYCTIQDKLVNAGYRKSSNDGAIHECYEKGVDSRQIVFFVHLPSKRLRAEKPVQEWLLTMYVAKSNEVPVQHNKIIEKISFGTHFIHSEDSNEKLLREEKRLISLVNSDAFRIDRLWRGR